MICNEPPKGCVRQTSRGGLLGGVAASLLQVRQRAFPCHIQPFACQLPMTRSL
jgi:hypothetical protein